MYTNTRKNKHSKKELYPQIKKIGLQIRENQGIKYVDRQELRQKLDELKITEKFNKYFGCQTQLVEGPYPSDVEAVLERIVSGKLTGTQYPLLWD